MTETKGTAVSSLAEFIKTRHGAENFGKWMDGLTPAAKAVYKAAIMPSDWYDLDAILAKPTELMCKMFYDGAVEGAFECGKFSAEIALKGVYKLFVVLGSPKFIIGNASTILPTYYRPSTMETVKIEKNATIIRITSFPNLDTYIENRLAGWMYKALETSGGKEISMKIPVALSKGATCTEFHVTWS